VAYFVLNDDDDDDDDDNNNNNIPYLQLEAIRILTRVIFNFMFVYVQAQHINSRAKLYFIAEL